MEPGRDEGFEDRSGLKVGSGVCGAILQEWYPLFENRFLSGTILDDFSL